MKNLIALVLGTLFGLILVKAEVLSWFRIQEMFAFQSFHMAGQNHRKIYQNHKQT